LASTGLGAVRSGDGDSVAVISGGGCGGGKGASALEGGVSGEERESGVLIISKGDDLINSVDVSACISGSKGTSNDAIAAITSGNIGGCDGGRVAGIGGSGTTKSVDAGVGSADEISVLGNVGEDGGGGINKGDALDSGCGGGATIRDTECTGNELVASVSGGNIRGNDRKGTAIIDRGGCTKGSNRGISAAFELNISGCSNKDGRVLIGDGDDVVAGAGVVAIITKGECTCQSTSASGSGGDLGVCNGLSNVAIIGEGGWLNKGGDISGIIAINSGRCRELVKEGGGGISKAECLVT